jgi:prepilin-type N-terminal cleavage/methylation domain-containing protein
MYKASKGGCVIYKKQQGISLIEVMAVMAIAGIFLGLALPSFKTIINRSQQEESAIAFANALAIARSEAVVRGTRVQVSPNSAADAPAGTGAYSGGVWSVSLQNGTPAFPGGDLSPVIKVFQVSPIDKVSTAADADLASAFVFNSDGTLQQTAVVTMCQKGEVSCKQLKVNLVGRTQLATVDAP